MSSVYGTLTKIWFEALNCQSVFKKTVLLQHTYWGCLQTINMSHKLKCPPSGAFVLRPLDLGDGEKEAEKIHDQNLVTKEDDIQFCSANEIKKAKFEEGTGNAYNLNDESVSVIQSACSSTPIYSQQSNSKGKNITAKTSQMSSPNPRELLNKMLISKNKKPMLEQQRRYKEEHSKGTVLPASILQGVTDMVASQKAMLPTQSTDTTMISDCDSNIDDSGIDIEQRLSVNEVDEYKGGEIRTMDIACKSNTDPVAKTVCFTEIKEAECECTSDIKSDRPDTLENELTQLDDADPFNDMQIGSHMEEAKQPTDIDTVYDVSELFSGELDKRRRRELKKMRKKSWKQPKKKQKGSLDEKDIVEDQSTGQPRKPIPNYFIAIQIPDPNIKVALEQVQSDIISVKPELSPAMNKLTTLHLTMMVLHLNTDEDMTRSKMALDEAGVKLMPLFSTSPLVLDIEGLGNFRNEVVFAKVTDEGQRSQLEHIAKVIEDCFLDQGIVSPDKKGFKPHITIVKLSKARWLWKKGIKKIDESLYADNVSHRFGTQNINTLQLCAMLKPKDKTGYYQVEHHAQFDLSEWIGLSPCLFMLSVVVLATLLGHKLLVDAIAIGNGTDETTKNVTNKDKETNVENSTQKHNLQIHWNKIKNKNFGQNVTKLTF